MKPPALSVVIPVYNESASLDELIQRCLAACRTLNQSFELILVDDGSRDDSARIIREAAGRTAEIIGVILNRNYGQHAAVMAGLAQSRGEIVVTLDADLQNPPEEIPNLVKEMNRGFDVVGSVRQHRQDSMFRRFASSMINRAVRRATGVMMNDYGCMLRAYRRPIINAMLQCREHSTFIPVLANSFARTTSEIPVSHAARSQGESKYSLFKLVSLQFDLLTSMSTFPLRLLSLTGCVVAAGGMAFGLFLLVMRLIYGAAWAVDGIFTLFSPLFILIGAQFIAMGLLGEYIGRIYQDVRNRPRYFVEKVIGAEANDPSCVNTATTLRP